VDLIFLVVLHIIDDDFRRRPVVLQEQQHRDSVPEMPAARIHHGHTMFIGRSNHFCILDRTTRLHHGRGAGGGNGVEAVAEREERIGRRDRSL
jgi:hypothetical protein